MHHAPCFFCSNEGCIESVDYCFSDGFVAGRITGTDAVTFGEVFDFYYGSGHGVFVNSLLLRVLYFLDTDCTD